MFNYSSYAPLIIQHTFSDTYVSRSHISSASPKPTDQLHRSNAHYPHSPVVLLQYKPGEGELDPGAGRGAHAGDTGQVRAVAVQPTGAAHRYHPDLRGEGDGAVTASGV